MTQLKQPAEVSWLLGRRPHIPSHGNLSFNYFQQLYVQNFHQIIRKRLSNQSKTFVTGPAACILVALNYFPLFVWIVSLIFYQVPASICPPIYENKRQHIFLQISIGIVQCWGEVSPKQLFSVLSGNIPYMCKSMFYYPDTHHTGPFLHGVMWSFWQSMHPKCLSW